MLLYLLSKFIYQFPPAISPESAITAFLEVLPDPDPIASSFLIISSPSMTSPKTTCLPSNQAVSAKVIKN